MTHKNHNKQIRLYNGMRYISLLYTSNTVTAAPYKVAGLDGTSQNVVFLVSNWEKLPYGKA